MPSSDSVPFVVKALYEYELEQEDDLPFETGQIIEVTEVCDDQWYYGQYDKDGVKLLGMFPKDYVQIYQEQTTAPTAPVVPASVLSQAGGDPAPHEPELPTIPKPKTVAAPIEDDWGSGSEDDNQEEEVAPITQQPASKLPPIDTLNIAKETPAEPTATPADISPTELKTPPIALPSDKDIASLEKLQTAPAPAPASVAQPHSKAKLANPTDQGAESTPGESLASNFKNRRGIFNQTEPEEPDNTKPLTRTRTDPPKLRKFNFPEEDSKPIERKLSHDDEAAAPRVSIKERLALIQKQEQEMRQREEQERKRREDEDEALRIEEERRNRELERQAELEAKETESNAGIEQQSSEPSGQATTAPATSKIPQEDDAGIPTENDVHCRSSRDHHVKQPSIPILPKVSDPAQEPKLARSPEDEEEEARKIALRERMARISGLGNAGGISLGMMLGRNPAASGAGSSGPRKPKKKDVSAMSDLERELYLASVEYDEAHGVAGEEEEEQVPGPEAEHDAGRMASEDADDATLVGARETDAETLAESDTEIVPGPPSTFPASSGETENSSTSTISAANHGVSPASPSKVVSGAPAAPAPVSSHSKNLEHKESVLSHTPAPVASKEVVGGAPQTPTSPHSAPPVPRKNSVASLRKDEEIFTPQQTDTTGLATGEDDASSSDEDDYSDASAAPRAPAAPAPADPVESLKKHTQLHAQPQSDSETGYDADVDDTDHNPLGVDIPKTSVADFNLDSPVAGASHSATTTTKTAPAPPPPVPQHKRAVPPPVPGSSVPQSKQLDHPAAPVAVPVRSPTVPARPPLPPQVPDAPSAPRRDEEPAIARADPSTPGRTAKLPHPPPVPPTVSSPPVASPPIPHPAPQTPKAAPPPPVPSVSTPRQPPQVPSTVPATRLKSSESSRAAPPPAMASPPVPAPAPRTAPIAPAKSTDRHPKGGNSSEIDLDLNTLWFTRQDGLPPSVDATKVNAEFEHNEVNKRGRVVATHDVYILNSDLSQVHINISYDRSDPAGANASQTYVAPPKVDVTELTNYSATIGSRVANVAYAHQGEITHTSAFVKSLFNQVPEALPPVKGTFGVSIYENFGGASVNQQDAIRPGDVAVLVQAAFQGSKSPLQKYHKNIANSVYIVQEWDGAKKKLRVFDRNKESFKLSDLQSGLVKIYRPVGRDLVGW